PLRLLLDDARIFPDFFHIGGALDPPREALYGDEGILYLMRDGGCELTEGGEAVGPRQSFVEAPDPRVPLLDLPYLLPEGLIDPVELLDIRKEELLPG